ncbi:sensor histidine kinase [Pontibacter populi]|uniref:histidine kinase n=1 Tax=Pontibacter populi TaxID=890055 RepID=A0ABV1RQK5_9BACT
MTRTIVHIGLHPETLDLLQQAVPFKDVQFCKSELESFKEDSKNLHASHALLIGEEVANPIRLAQDAFTHDKTISVLLVNDSNNYLKIKQALQFSPFIGPTVLCISNETGARMAPIVEDAMQRTAQRRSFAKVKGQLAAGQQFAPNALDRVRTDFTTKVLQEAPIGAVLVSGTGIVFSINNYALNIFGKSEKEVLGQMFSSLFPEHVSFAVKQFVLDGYLSNGKQVFEVIKGESVKYLELSVAPINLETSANYKLVLVNNISESVLAQQRTQAHLQELESLNANLERVNTDLDTFVYTASHDLKSPILNIEGLVSSLEYELGDARSAVALELDHIKRSIGRFKQTVEDLTEVSRIQRSFEQDATLIDLAAIVEEVMQLLDREIKEAGATIDFKNEGLSTVRFHKKNLTSIVYNLINNAIKYRSPDRKPIINIKTWRDKECFCLEVQDNGLGIPEAKRERVFQLFKRMHSHVEGSGVGLYIVKRIVENNGGSIAVESEEGKGTVFILHLKEYTA